jgi:hypothetical protein
MPFSASTCLTDLGTTLLGGTFNIYSNVDNYISPFQTNVSYTSLFGPSCPYVMGNVPDSTTSIRIIDTLTKCCATIELLSNDLCTTCDLSFDSYQTNTIGLIVAGELTGSCENEITDYRIFWYGPNDPNELAFISGFGSDTDFLPRDFTHPLTGINSPMQPAGTYVPVIDKVKLNGLNYSQTGGTGYIQAELECFNATTVNVQPFTCDNGTVPLPNDYTHRVNFAGAAAGTTPLTLNSTFELDPTTNYFSWKFKAESIPDSLKITFYGSSYSEPIILEYWVVGNNLTSSNINLLTFPKSGKTSSYLSKVTSLTSLTRSPGDYLILEVIPNQNNTQTNWDFYFTCMDNFDCDLCLYDYLNTPYKIKSSSITGITGSCSSIRVNYDLSGCTTNSIQNSDIYKYQSTSLANINTTVFYEVGANNSTGLLNVNTPNILDWNQTSCSANYDFTTTPTCSPSNTNTIKFIKENTGPSGQGVIKMEFSSLSDLIHYKSSYDLLLPYSGTPSNPADPNYYRFFTLYIPKNATPSTQCGDNTTVLGYDIHYSSVVTTGTTGGIYTLNITMPTISNGLPPFDPCDLNCEYYVNTYFPTFINGSSTGVTNVENFTTNTGSKYVRPFGASLKFTVQPPTVVSGSTNHGYYYLNNFLNSTVPFSGSSSPYTQIPSLSALTCNNFTSIGQSGGGGIQQFVSVYHYRVELTDPNNVKSFRILAAPIVNGVSSNIFSDVVATVINGVLQLPTNPLYTF